MAQAAAGKSNRFAVWVSVAVIAVIAVVIGLVVWMNSLADAPAARPDSAGIDQETGAVLIGTGEGQVSVFSDFYCPHCQDFEDVYGATLSDALEEGLITLSLHPVALAGLNTASGTDFSKRSANALYCVADAEPAAAYPFFTTLIGKKPTGAGQTDAELAEIAKEAGAGDISACLADRPWDSLVEEQTKAIPANPETGSAGTPTLLIDGEYVSLTGNPQADILDRLK